MKWEKIAGIARVLKTDDEVFVFCTGSNGYGDWKRNLRTRRVEVGEYRVNVWDYQEAAEVFSVMLPMVDGQDIVIAGFSRGGAVAAVVHMLFEKSGYNPRLITWAPKRAGIPIHGKAHRGDIVPYLPPWYPKIKLTKPKERRLWPWAAHKQSAHDAAKWRQDVENGTERANP